MKQAFLFLLVALAVPFAGARAQNIALGERTPELKVSTWLGGQQPSAAPLSYIEFFFAQNPACITSLDRLKEFTSKSDTKLRVVVVTREKEAEKLLTPYVSERISVGMDPTGKTFTAFGVTYVPFGVLTDSKNRALWMGNSLQLTPEILEKYAK